jgi:hypothetical protein
MGGILEQDFAPMRPIPGGHRGSELPRGEQDARHLLALADRLDERRDNVKLAV